MNEFLALSVKISLHVDQPTQRNALGLIRYVPSTTVGAAAWFAWMIEVALGRMAAELISQDFGVVMRIGWTSGWSSWDESEI